MKRSHSYLLCLLLTSSLAGCWVHAGPEHPHRREHVRREVIVVHDHDRDHDHHHEHSDHDDH